MQRRSSGTSGQAVVSFALALLAFAISATAVIDVGLIVNDRRDAQADVDRAALAGALALTLNPYDAVDDGVAARQAARSWAASNGINESEESVTLTVTVISSCYSLDDGVPTGVQVTVEREPSTFLVSYLGIDEWRTTATATACAGRPTEMDGFLPFALSEASSCFETNGEGARVPLLGQFCDLVIDSNSQGLSGELGIAPGAECADGNSSASVLHDNIVYGTQTACAIGDTVVGNSGHNVGQTQSGISERLSTEGACDANFPVADQSLFNLGVNAINGDSPDVLTDFYPPYNSHGDGIDDFFEVWQLPPGWTSGDHPAGDLVPYDCDPSEVGLQTSPRNVALLVISDFAAPDGDAGPKSYIVQSFARVYVEGCSDSVGVFYRDCDISGGGKFTIHARFVDQVAASDATLGLDASFGDIEVFLRH